MPAHGQLVEIDGRRLRLTNLEKVLYPETGTTKGEVIDYYTRIAAAMIPHLRGRPVTRIRWPDGVGHPPFFAKDLERGAPEWLPRRRIEHSGGAKEYPLVDDTAALVYVAQVASLELHTPQWRFDASRAGGRGNPDRLVLDLDPGPGAGLPECAEVARWARAILADIGLPPLPVTSGSKGIHLYAALDGMRSSDDIAAVAHELARALEADHPDLVVSSMSKAARAGRVLVDWSQNNQAKTTVAPYSLRGRDAPTVAAPRTWEELSDPNLRQLGAEEVLERVAADGDLLAPLVTGGNALGAYVAKRRRGRTPEPFPEPFPEPLPGPSPERARDAGAPQVSSVPGAGREGGGGARFVVQEHHASRLHYDLRLERDGVLVSWAVPRGMPGRGDRNHLAVMTEPHPLAYLDFAGTIPAGEYGAGTMTIWDAGTYRAEKWRADEVIVEATGRPGGPLGRARFALIRTSGDGERSQWLLHRMTDTAETAGRPAAGPRPDGGDGERPAAGPTHVGPRERTVAPDSPGTRTREGAGRRGGRPILDAPMLATAATAQSAGTAIDRWDEPWVEFKWDGIRALATWDGERLTLRARSGTDITARYPELTGPEVVHGLGSERAVLDGEIVAMDVDGRPSFSRLQARMHLTVAREIERESRRTPVSLLLFDILRLGDDDLAARPLHVRRAALDDVAAGAAAPIILPPVTDDLGAALSAARDLRLEGVIVKDPRSPYRRGRRSEEWLKVKLTATQDVVIGGIRPGRGGRTGSIGSLLLGIPDAEGLRYVGRVGSGFSDRELARLAARLGPLRTEVDPFVGVPPADAADALWLEPELVGEVEFAEFTPSGTLRHARWRGLRDDVAPGEVRRDG